MKTFAAGAKPLETLALARLIETLNGRCECETGLAELECTEGGPIDRWWQRWARDGEPAASVAPQKSSRKWRVAR